MPTKTEKSGKKPDVNHKNTEEKGRVVLGRHHLPTVWIDSVNFSSRSDGMCLIRMISDLPEGLVEEARIMTHTDKIKRIVDEICATLNYYPDKPKQKK